MLFIHDSFFFVTLLVVGKSTTKIYKSIVCIIIYVYIYIYVFYHVTILLTHSVPYYLDPHLYYIESFIKCICVEKNLVNGSRRISLIVPVADVGWWKIMRCWAAFGGDSWNSLAIFVKLGYTKRAFILWGVVYDNDVIMLIRCIQFEWRENEKKKNHFRVDLIKMTF